ncbi:hypothetical protein Tco_0229475, partial [Tanacetum coccineum]
AHKLLFKEVVGKLVKRVKLLEDKLKGRKRKYVLTDSDKEEDAELDVDPLIKLAKAAATAVSTGGSHEADIPPSSSIPTDEFAGCQVTQNWMVFTCHILGMKSGYPKRVQLLVKTKSNPLMAVMVC